MTIQQWYAAHCIMALRVLEGTQDHFPVHENVILIRAGTPREAWELAGVRGREDESHPDSGTRFYDDDPRPARWTFEGVRKVVECDDLQADPAYGVEVTYSALVVDTEEDLRKLASGESVTVWYED